VTPALLVGPSITAADVPRLRRAGVRGILSLQEPGPDIRVEAIERVRAACLAAPPIAWRNVPVRDYDPADLVARLPDALAALRELAPRGPVYLHCCEGVNRAPSVAVAFLVLACEHPLDDALALLRAAHPVARPYDAFLDWLRDRTP
jgi:hypothetical protein